jgi:translation initiation factor IF-3
LQGGDKVKATIWFRGREMTHRELGARILERLEKDLLDVGEIEARPRMEGNQMFSIFGPKKHKGGGGGGTAKPAQPAATATAPASPKPEGQSAPPQQQPEQPQPAPLIDVKVEI